MSGTAWVKLEDGVRLGFTRTTPNGRAGRRFLLFRESWSEPNVVLDVPEGGSAAAVLHAFLLEQVPDYMQWGEQEHRSLIEVAHLVGELTGTYDSHSSAMRDHTFACWWEEEP